MRTCSFCSLILLTGAMVFPAAFPTSVTAHTPYGKALKSEYKLKSVSCYACHAKGKDEEGKPLGKEHLNGFGEALGELLKDKEIGVHLEAAKDKDARTAANELAIDEFLKALKQVESEATAETPDKTWRQLIESGDWEGVTLRK